MPISLEAKIRDHLVDYLSGSIALQEFLDRFMDAAEDAEAMGDPRILHLVDRIKLYWAEFTSSDRTEEEFRQSLRGILAMLKVPLTHPVDSPKAVVWASSSTGYTPPLGQSLRGAAMHQPPTWGFFAFGTNADSESKPLSEVDNSEWNTTDELILK